MNRFCVKCGKETNEVIRGLCQNCFLEKKKAIELPKEIVIDFDKRSGKIRVERSWVENNEETYEKIVKEKILKLADKKRLEIKNLKIVFEEDKKNINANISFETTFEGVKLAVKDQIVLVFHSTISDASMKIASYYHEAIMQIRFKEKPSPEEEKERLRQVMSALIEEKKRNELSEAVDVKKERGGYDLFVASKKAAKIVSSRISKKFNAEVTYSNKLLGKDENGQDKFRHTYCIRF